MFSLKDKKKKANFVRFDDYRLPEVNVKGVYTSDTNLNKYHDYAIKKLTLNIKNNSEREKRIEDLDKLINSNINIVEKKNFTLEKKELQEKIKNSRELLDDYLIEAEPLIQEFRTARPKIPLILGNKTRGTNIRRIIRAYEKVINKYCPEINLTSERIPPDECPYCHSILKSDNESVSVCPGCSHIFEENDFVPELEMSTPDFIVQNNKYESKDNFINTLNAFQGHPSAPVEDKLYQDLDKYCKRKKIRKEDLTPSLLREIFSKIGYSKRYDAINMVLHEYANKPLPDISKIRNSIIDMYTKFDREFRNIKGDNRHSSINTQRVLYILLRYHGYECNKEDFKIPNTKDIDLNHRVYIDAIFENLGIDSSKYV